MGQRQHPCQITPPVTPARSPARRKSRSRTVRMRVCAWNRSSMNPAGPWARTAATLMPALSPR
ncbi:MAG: hypothetical protein MZV64_62600 [Ignavibacteriales bacterium]|nr:hypothetical protein [Ignavibacteriales bacterium]